MLHDLPPSTLAAQLIESLTRAKQYSGHRDRADFENLLQIFETEHDRGQHAETPEDVEESAKLIDVVVKAGIDPLCQDNPFEGRKTTVCQATRSLRVVDVTIKRCSEVLCFRNSREEVKSRFYGPLYLWLLPKLLSVGTYEQDESLHSAAASVIHTIIDVDRKISLKDERPHRFNRYTIGCVQGRLPETQNADASSSLAYRSLMQIALWVWRL